MPERWPADPRFDAVSDSAVRVWVAGLAWSAGAGTDGKIPLSALRHLHPDGPRPDIAAELVVRGVWGVDGDGWRNLAYQDDQTRSSDAARLREQARERQRRKRDNDRARRVTTGIGHSTSRVTTEHEPPPAKTTVTRDDSVTAVTRDEVRRGEARRGEAKNRKCHERRGGSATCARSRLGMKTAAT